MPTHRRAAADWIQPLASPRPGPRSGRTRLFCFPYAGGGAMAYRKWPAALADEAELFAVQPPGREERLADPAFLDLDSLLAELVPILLPYLDVPFAFFGHSMGALICAEAARVLHTAHARTPSRLFVSGSQALHLAHDGKKRYLLSDEELIDEIRGFNGTPEEMLRHPEMVSMLLPLIRADFSILGTYRYVPGPRLTCPITVLVGERDPLVDADGLCAWQDLTIAAVDIELFPGDHFYLQSSQAALLAVIASRLRQTAPGNPASARTAEALAAESRQTVAGRAGDGADPPAR
jgi:surfactin synthase thioesterase subunit